MATTLKDWDSKSELMTHLMDLKDDKQPYVLIGEDAEAPRRFCSLSFEDRTGQCLEIALIMSFHGIEPSWTTSVDGESIAIGHDLSVSIIDAAQSRVVAVRRLDGAFYGFVATDRPDEILVCHELGVVKMNFLGDELWSVHTTDILLKWIVPPNGTLVLRQWGDEKELVIDMRTGNRVLGG